STSEWTVPATADANSLGLFSLSANGRTAKFEPLKPHHLFGLSPRVNFDLGDPYRLQMELEISSSQKGEDVRTLTDKIAKLAGGDQHRPPTALLTWGTGLAFKCIF